MGLFDPLLPLAVGPDVGTVTGTPDTIPVFDDQGFLVSSNISVLAVYQASGVLSYATIIAQNTADILALGLSVTSISFQVATNALNNGLIQAQFGSIQGAVTQSTADILNITTVLNSVAANVTQNTDDILALQSGTGSSSVVIAQLSADIASVSSLANQTSAELLELTGTVNSVAGVVANITASIIGTPNTFAGFDNTGHFETIPGWLFDSITKGANVSLSYDPTLGSTTIQSFMSDFSPSANAGNDESGFSFLTTHDNAQLGFDNAGTVTGVSIGQVMKGNGTLDAQRTMIIDQHSGDGASTGVVGSQSLAEMYSEVTSGSTVTSMSGLILQANINGALTGDIALLNGSVNNGNVGGNLSGFNLAINSAITANAALVNLTQNGSVGQNLIVFAGNNNGAIGNDLQFISYSNNGTIGGNHFAFNYSNQTAAQITGQFFGTNIVNSASVSQAFTGHSLNNSGHITKGLTGFQLNNSGDLGDGTGPGITGIDLNFHTGSVDGPITGLNFANSMPFASLSNLQALNVNNTGSGGSFTGLTLNNNANQVESIQGINYNSTGNSRTQTAINLTPNGAVTDDFNGIRLTMQGSAGSVNGASFDVDSVVCSQQKSALSANGGSFSANSPYDTSVLPATPGEFQNNIIGGFFHIASGHPMSSSFGFGNNLGITIIADDDMAADLTLGGESLGFSVNGFVNQISVAAGKTIDTLNYMMAGGGITAGSGSITNLSLFRALGFLPEGGTLSVDNLYAFKADSFLTSVGAINEWGFWSGSPTANNWFKKNVVIGGVTGLPTGSANLDVTGFGTITATATDAPIFALTVSATSNTTTDGSNNTEALQTVATATVASGATNDKALAGTVNTVQRGDGTDNGTLDTMGGIIQLLFHNSGVSGVTTNSFGFSSVIIPEQGTITNHYDYYAERAPAGGTITNHFGVYIKYDSVSPVQNWLSGKTLLGHTSFTSPTAVAEFPASDGSSGTAPIKLTAGTLLATPENGAVESDGSHVYWTNNGGNRIQLDGGSGTGGSGSGKNYLTTYKASTGAGNPNPGNGDFENGNTDGWSLASSNLSSTLVPTSTAAPGTAFSSTNGGMTPASPGISLTVTSTASIAQQTSGQILFGTNISAGDLLISDSFFIDKEDQARVLGWKVSFLSSNPNVFDMSGTSTNTFAIYFYDVDNAKWIQPSGVYSMNQISGVGLAEGTFQSTSNGTRYQMAIVVANSYSGITTPNIILDSFNVGPQILTNAPAMGDFKLAGVSVSSLVGATTTAPVLGITSTDRVFTRQVGDHKEYSYELIYTSAGTAGSGDYLFSLPAGDSFDLTKITADAGGPYGAPSETVRGSVLGTAAGDFENVDLFEGVIIPYDATRFRVALMQEPGSSAGYISSSTFAPVGTSGSWFFKFSAPIAGLSSNSVASADTSTRVTAFAGQLTSTQSVTANVTDIAFPAQEDTAAAWNGTQYVATVSGDYSVSTVLSDNASTTLSFAVYLNGVLSKQLLDGPNGHTGGGNTLVPGVKAGDLISIRCGQTTTLSALGNLSIFRLSGPSAISASESVNFTSYNSPAITGTPGTGPAIFGSKNKDTHNAYDITTGIYTCPAPGSYRVSMSLSMDGTWINTSAAGLIFQNGSTVAATTSYWNGAGAIGTCTVTLDCVTGDQIYVQGGPNGGTGVTYSAANVNNMLSIERVGN